VHLKIIIRGVPSTPNRQPQLLKHVGRHMEHRPGVFCFVPSRTPSPVRRESSRYIRWQPLHGDHKTAVLAARQYVGCTLSIREAQWILLLASVAVWQPLCSAAAMTGGSAGRACIGENDTKQRRRCTGVTTADAQVFSAVCGRLFGQTLVEAVRI